MCAAEEKEIDWDIFDLLSLGIIEVREGCEGSWRMRSGSIANGTEIGKSMTLQADRQGKFDKVIVAPTKVLHPNAQ